MSEENPPFGSSPAVSVKVDHKVWMTSLRPILSKECLADVRMVGTHDSGSYAILPKAETLAMGPACDGDDILIKLLSNCATRGIARAVTVPWARAQRHSIKGQLERGVRFLDIRLGIYPGMTPLEYRQKMKDEPNFAPAKEEIWTCHTVWGSPWSEVVNDIAAFFNELPEGHVETLIIDVKSVDGFDHARHYQQLVDSLAPIAPWLIRGDANLDGPLASIWEHAQQRIVFLYRDPHTGDDAKKKQELKDTITPLMATAQCRPRQSYLWSEWHDSPKAEVVAEGCQQVLNGGIALPVRPQPQLTTLIVCQGVVTPAAKQIFGGLCCCCCSAGSLEELVEPMTDAALRLWEEYDVAKNGGVDRRNVLLLDFFDQGVTPKGLSAVDLCIELNRARAGSVSA